MPNRVRNYFQKRIWLLLIIGFSFGIIALIGFNRSVEYTSTNDFCASCHVHPHVFDSWQLSTHYDNASGMQVKCVDCHLPPKGEGYLKEKVRLGAKDIYGFWFKDHESFNWEAKSTVEQAQHFTYKASCTHCHANIFPLQLTKEGQDAHLYYTQHEHELHCINCHLDAGHYNPNAKHESNVGFGKGVEVNREVYTEPAAVNNHESFSEKIPGTTVSFSMIAIPGGSFTLGSPSGEPYRKEDEGPQRQVEISPFFMGEVEVSWDEYLAFYAQTGAEGRSTDTEGSRTELEVDAITGPTPPYGQPDQNWGLGQRPAITMSHEAAETYCRWLSKVTGKTYRLPTEAEWEYACRAGTQTPYFFEGNPKDFSTDKLWNKLFGADTTNINSYVVYEKNSLARTQLPSAVRPNPYGLKNMLGNVAEFCQDWYAPDAYQQLTDGVRDPKGPASGSEHVVRGGSFKSGPAELRSASRDFTRTTDWLKTDPQMPKSKWWYSDVNTVGFRVVCEFDELTGNN
ncbi:SUMF1/EgtB/PvdO family nonheme iron enzyme [Gaoshiqia sediminis]|uniref:SUMF1/EgtB/PvdO family nonheme iron enzyme n=1 Tax=Gaoshiqia sediminis TaxID=2986998 RepID=A0AA42C9E2_9BACT|nr:SUMF1/EgtB/PvdO family nonheme iron enzyme [Gaoshiqia sediminis]MCW0483841.1 SUMF1/EgtB/PvdO family nonheme iron enzyme [Gaoshiqia sediminis]